MSNDTMRETVRRARELLAFVSPEPDNWSEHNALIAAGLCNDELPALCDEIERLRADLSRVTEERNALRAIVEGRTTAPTDAEFEAHEASGGFWLVDARTDEDYVVPFVGRIRRARLWRDSVVRDVARWLPCDRDGRPCAWPVVSRG